MQGLRIEVMGDANDYVGKGLSGATIVLRLSPSSDAAQSEQHHHRQYGACMARRPESCSPRGAPANASPCAIPAPPPSIEGCGSNGCEYMTGGTAVILGAVGDNFGAGFTGGMAFVYDRDRQTSS